MNKITKRITIAVATLFALQANAGVTVIDFDTDSGGNAIVNGQVIDTELGDVTLTVANFNNEASNLDTTDDYAVAFDTLHDSVQDEDLEYNGAGNAYNGTGPFSYTELEIDGIGFGDTPGNILIMQNIDQYSDSLDGCDTGICDNPNDENGTDPAGYFEFNFGQIVDIISLDTFDIEDNGEFIISLFANNSLVTTMTETSAGLGATTLQEMGDGEFVRQILNVVGVDMIRIQLPGSGAIDNLAFRTAEVSAPATLGILSLALLMMRRRARSKK
jgi:hypothetical protein